MKRILCLTLTFVMLLACFTGCSDKPNDAKKFNTFEDFENAKLGVLTGSEFDRQTSVLFPNSEKLQFANVPDLILSLETDKIDGFLIDSTYYSAITWEKQGYKAISDDKTTPVSFAAMLSESTMAKKIKSELDDFITRMKSSGAIDTLAEKWFSGSKPTELEDYSALSGENGTISVAIANAEMPMSYVSENIARGFDIELMIAFAREYGYKLDFVPVDFEAKLEGIASNKYDVAVGGITVTDERREKMIFSEAYYESPVIMVTKGEGTTQTRLSDLSGQRIGVLTGSIQAVMMPKIIPDADYIEFNSMADLIVALNNNKIDAFGCDESLYTSMLWEGQAVDRIDEPLDKSDYGIIFPKGQELDLQNEVNEYIAQINVEVTVEALE